jgi:hypothetical protein
MGWLDYHSRKFEANKRKYVVHGLPSNSAAFEPVSAWSGVPTGNLIRAGRLLFAYAIVRPESEQNSSHFVRNWK